MASAPATDAAGIRPAAAVDARRGRHAPVRADPAEGSLCRGPGGPGRGAQWIVFRPRLRAAASRISKRRQLVRHSVDGGRAGEERMQPAEVSLNARLGQAETVVIGNGQNVGGGGLSALVSRFDCVQASRWSCPQRQRVPTNLASAALVGQRGQAEPRTSSQKPRGESTGNDTWPWRTNRS